MEKKGSALAARVKERSGLKRRETVEEQMWNAMRVQQGKVFVDSKEDALALALEWADRSGTV